MVVFSNLSIHHIDIYNKQLPCQNEVIGLSVIHIHHQNYKTPLKDLVVRLRDFKLMDMVNEPSQNIVIHLLVIRL